MRDTDWKKLVSLLCLQVANVSYPAVCRCQETPTLISAEAAGPDSPKLLIKYEHTGYIPAGGAALFIILEQEDLKYDASVMFKSCCIVQEKVVNHPQAWVLFVSPIARL